MCESPHGLARTTNASFWSAHWSQKISWDLSLASKHLDVQIGTSQHSPDLGLSDLKLRSKARPRKAASAVVPASSIALLLLQIFSLVLQDAAGSAAQLAIQYDRKNNKDRHTAANRGMTWLFLAVLH